jgi:hypothetical protein
MIVINNSGKLIASLDDALRLFLASMFVLHQVLILKIDFALYATHLLFIVCLLKSLQTCNLNNFPQRIHLARIETKKKPSSR